MSKKRADRPLFSRISMPDLLSAPMQGTAVQSVELSVFADQKSRANTNTGHGEMAEEAITLIDNLFGMDAEVTGRDNAKDGPDRRVGETYIQTKYYNSARSSMEACFDNKTGLYRYIRDGEPMQLEVPADQYDRVVELFAAKIKNGLVPGVTDPAEASVIIRRGRLTYQQAIDLTRPLTLESLTYDAAGGALVSICAMGFSFLTASVSAFCRTRDIKKSLQSGLRTGFQALGRVFGQHLLISQLARTDLAASLLPAAEAAVDPLSRETVKALSASVRFLTGKAAVTASVAEGQLARMLRTGVISSAAIFLLLTISDAFRAVTRRISGMQLIKNTVCRLFSLTGGTLGAIAAGGLLGSPASPILGTLCAMGGAFLGGTLLSWLISMLFGLFRKDDFTLAVGSINDAAVQLLSQFNLSSDEAAMLKCRFHRIPMRDLRRLQMQLRRSTDSGSLIHEFLIPHFRAVTGNRPVSPAQHKMTLEMPDIG